MLAISLFLALCLPVLSYVPASPTNSTRDAIAGGLNISDISQLYMQWYSNGSYSEHVSYQLAGNDSSGISKGVLVHFSEEIASNITAPTATPWIALVSCDRNATNMSMEEDIFTLARDKGAVSALLYSLYSAACVINPEYSDPATFDQVFDIFSTQSATSSHLIEYQFGQLGPQNKSLFAYDSEQLNNSATDILLSINMSIPVSPGYLLAVLAAYNATGDNSGPTSTGSNTGVANLGNSSSPNTALAMIILYAITGCVSALFCIVIISGAIRAIRHPERYGPRARLGDDGGPPQSRARGLTRAILDTFPIVKFGSNPVPSTLDPTLRQTPGKDVEGQNQVYDEGFQIFERVDKIIPPRVLPRLAVRADDVESSGTNLSEKLARPISQPRHKLHCDASSKKLAQLNDLGEGSSKANPPIHFHANNSMPSINCDKCPICIVDFEEGDDLRVLPCDGKHRFHKNCVDPWLLELSSSCPICRHDFHGEDSSNIPDLHSRGSRNPGRISRYLHLGHRHQPHQPHSDEHDPTDPYMPSADH